MCWASTASVSGLKSYSPAEPGSGSPLRENDLDAETVYERMRLALEDLGPTFVKFGQIMSTRTELLPPELIERAQETAGPCKTHPVF